MLLDCISYAVIDDKQDKHLIGTNEGSAKSDSIGLINYETDPGKNCTRVANNWYNKLHYRTVQM